MFVRATVSLDTTVHKGLSQHETPCLQVHKVQVVDVLAQAAPSRLESNLEHCACVGVGGWVVRACACIGMRQLRQQHATGDT